MLELDSKRSKIKRRYFAYSASTSSTRTTNNLVDEIQSSVFLNQFDDGTLHHWVHRRNFVKVLEEIVYGLLMGDIAQDDKRVPLASLVSFLFIQLIIGQIDG